VSVCLWLSSRCRCANEMYVRIYIYTCSRCSGEDLRGGWGLGFGVSGLGFKA